MPQIAVPTQWTLGPKCAGAEVLVQLARQRATGVLVYSRGTQSTRVQFLAGRPIGYTERDSAKAAAPEPIHDRTQVVARVRALAVTTMGGCEFEPTAATGTVVGAPADIDTLGETLVAVVTQLQTAQRDALWQARGRWRCTVAPTFAQLSAAIASVTGYQQLSPPTAGSTLEQLSAGQDEHAHRSWAALILLGGIVLTEANITTTSDVINVIAPSPASQTPALSGRPGSTAPQHPIAVEVQAAYNRLSTQDHYMFLGVERHAPSDQIRKAYFDKAKLWHTDRFAGMGLPDAVLKQAEALFHRGEEAYRVLNDPGTRASYDWVLQRQAAGLPSDPEVIVAAEKLFVRGQQMVRAGHLAKAEPILRQAVDMNGGEAEFVAFLGYAVYGARGPSGRAEAEEVLQRALAMQPKLDVAHEFLGKIARMEGDWEAAQRHLQNALEINPRNYEAVREQRWLTMRVQQSGRPGAGATRSGSPAQSKRGPGIMATLQAWWDRWTKQRTK